MSVSTTHPLYDIAALQWKRCRDVIAGRDAMIQRTKSTLLANTANSAYIPPLANQSDAEYRAYQERALFFNATARTLDALAGMIFAKDPQWQLPAAIDRYEQDITLSDVTLREYAEQVVEQQLAVGRVGMMVDFPANTTAGLSIAEAERTNQRPFLRWYSAETIINWRSGMVNGAEMLTLVVLMEKVDTPKGEFEIETVTQYRVLDLTENGYRVRLMNDNGEVISETIPLSNGAPLSYIPFIILGAFHTSPIPDKPPLLDLADANIAHFRNSADYEHGLHFTGLPTPYVAGVQLQEGQSLSIGSMTAWVFPDPAAKAQYLEFSGDGLQSLANAMKDKQAMMAVLGARMLSDDKRAAEAYQTMELRTAGERSVLASVARAASDAITRLLGIMAEWAGAADTVEFSLNTDFGAARMQPQMLTSLMGTVQAGLMPNQVFFENIQRGELVRPDMTWEEYQAQLELQPPDMEAPEPINE